MRRRAFVIAAGSALALPLAATAQSTGKLPRVGVVLNSAAPAEMEGAEPELSVMRGFIHGLRALGYAEGRNIVIERRTAEGKLERLEGLIRELAQMPVDVIVVTGVTMALAAKKATTAVPIVAAGMGSSAVERGIVASLPRPGGNITGLEPVFGRGLVIKQLEILREMAPNVKRIAYFNNDTDGGAPSEEYQAAARKLGFVVTYVDAQLPNIEKGLAQLERERPDALQVPPSASLFVHQKAIVNAAAKLRVPSIFGFDAAVDFGALAFYGHDSYDMFRRAAGYVDRILKGARPADMAIEQMERWFLVLNLKTAGALGLTIPQSVLVRADRLIK